MLKKNKDYVEFTLQCTSVDWARSKDCPEVCLKGYSDFSFPGVPMDVVCNEFDHKVVVVSKRDFERLQADDQYYRELAKQREENYKALLDHICDGRTSVDGWMVTAKLWRRNYETLSKLIGFSSVEKIQDYLTNEAECDTLQEAISKLKDQVKYTCDEWYSANSRNNSWKAAAECNSPHELIEKLNLLRDDISGRSTVIESYKRDIEKWQKTTGYLRPEDISTDSMISKSMANEINTANEKLWRENEKCEKRIEGLLSEIREWRETTDCPSPSSAKTLIESGMSYEYAYHEAQKENRKLTEEIDSWEHVTGFSSPEDYMHERISGAFHTPFDYTAAWQKATSCETPEEAKELISSKNGGIVELKNRLDASLTANEQLKKKLQEFDVTFALSFFWKEKYETFRNALKAWKETTGCSTPEEAGCKINSLCDDICKLKSWEETIGFSTPEKCSSYIDRLEKKLEDIKNLTEED